MERIRAYNNLLEQLKCVNILEGMRTLQRIRTGEQGEARTTMGGIGDTVPGRKHLKDWLKSGRPSLMT